MANQRYNGKNVNLYRDVSATSTPDWLLVACLTDLTATSSAATIDAASKCGPYQLPGNITESYSFTGFYEPSNDATNVSMYDLYPLFKDQKIHHWKISDDGTNPLTPSTPSTPGSFVYEEFYGALTSFNRTFSEGAVVGFDGEIAVSGDIIYQLTT